MANRFYSPDQQFISNSGIPYAEGFLYFYATGTSTPLNTYSDAALTIANTNPVVLDSNGQAGSVFLQNLAYKVVLQDANHIQIWTMDPVYTSDYSTYAQFQVYNGNPNGFVAGNAGTVGTLPGSSVIWDYVDDILYVCTVTGNASTAVWTAVNQTTATSATPAPQGFLTVNPDPSNPVVSADVVASTAVYYTPYTGTLVPVYNGSSFSSTVFSQLVLTLSASQALNTIYDVFVFNNSGVLTLVTGPAWSVSTAGSGSRGTGAGTTQLQRLNGLWVNAVAITGINSATTYTIPANTATYLGSIFVDGTAGQVSCYVSFGQSRKWGVWNAYNRAPIAMQAGDSTTNWTYNTNTIRPANNNTANSLTTFIGLPEETISIAESQWGQVVISALTGTSYTFQGAANIGIGLNSTTTFVTTGTAGSFVQGSSLSSTNGASIVITYTFAGSERAQMQALLSLPPSTIGINTITALENSSATNCNVQYLGTQASMVLTAKYRG